MPQAHLNFIGGKWVPSEDGATFRVTNPADPAQDLGEFQLSTREDAKTAVESARAAHASWRSTPAPLRGKVLYKAAEIIESKVDEFARTLTTEEGKTLADSLGEVRRAVDLFRFYGGQGSRLDGKTYPSSFPKTFLYSVREPVGVVVLMTPWNFPIAIPAWKMAPALVSGNSVVFKPASLTPGIATKLVSALEQAGVPPGVLNLVTGPGSTVGEELALNREVDAISFTGSYEVGDGIQRARANSGKMARIQLEMGGKNPTIVLPDAKLEDAVEVVAKSAFGLTGQACTATSRVMVHESVKERFTAMLVDRARSFRVGNGLEQGVEMGPAVSRSELEKDLRYVEIGKGEGANLIAGGGRPSTTTSTGYFMQPTIFDNVFADMKIAKEEIFGPVLSVFEVKSVDEAVELANKSEFGLTACICTSNLGSALDFADRVQAGIVKINRPTVGLELQVPFGGIKKSSSDSFKEQGEEGIDFYTRIKTVYMGY
ncbi:MAG: aldehyde dehydrogenase family protein [Thaumarchaeota archaeon]|nr:aldehyde dehydrogenase family protein [Nitrososphaerota archaeon]